MINNMRNETEKLVRFIRKNEIQMKECLMPVSSDPNGPAAIDAKCYCGELRNKHYQELQGSQYEYILVQNGKTGGNSLPVSNTTKPDSTPKGLNISEWKRAKPIEKLPTNAAGKIRFIQEDGLRRMSDFIRISDDTEITTLFDLFRHHWSLFTPEPSLVISILGGAKNLKMDSKISSTFKSGLIRAAKSTNAWIITGGFNVGVMKLVGDAVAEWQGVQFDESGQPREAVRCIGIAPWGYVKQRENLVARETGGLSTFPFDGRTTAKRSTRLGGVFDYEPSSISKHGDPPSLNPHHTHYVLIDTGTRNKFDAEVGNFRANLELKISEKSTEKEKQKSIPVVVVLVEGGEDSIEGCKQSIKTGIPVVVCMGTGRAADILAYAIQNSYRDRKGDTKSVKFSPYAENHIRDRIYRSYYEKIIKKFFDTWEKGKTERKEELGLLEKIEKAYQKVKSDSLPRLLYLSSLPESLKRHCDKTIDKTFEHVKACCVDENLLTYFDSKSDKEDFDYAILAALAKKKSISESKSIEHLKEQLQLALTWNRSDIADKDIFARQHEAINSYEIKDIIFDAILKNRVDFLQVLLSNGVVINDLLSRDMLRKLYKEALSDSQRNTPDANHIYKRLRTAGGKLDGSVQRELAHGNIRLCAVHKLISMLLGTRYMALAKESQFEHGSRYYDEYQFDSVDQRIEFQLPVEVGEVVMNNPFRELFFFAVLLNRTDMAKFFWKHTDDCMCLALIAAKVFNSLASSCQGHQMDLKRSYQDSKQIFEDLACSLCNESYKNHAERALILVERRYEIAGSNCLEIAGVHKIVGGLNCLEIGSSAEAQVFLSTTCCQDALDALWKQQIRSGSAKVLMALLMPLLILFLGIEKPGEEDSDESSLSLGQKIRAFYRAPVTKFVFWHISFMAYLLMYTYVLIFDFSKEPSNVEIAIYCWTFTLFVDNLAEIGHMQALSLRIRIRRWLQRSVWNWAMMVGYVFHIAGVCCRLLADGDEDLSYAGKVMLTCCLFIMICRISRVFSVHAWLGPKLVMIRKMLIELGRWLIILTIFNIAFGVMRVAIMFRGDQIMNYKTVDAIVYFPFWNLWNDYDMTLDPDAEYYCSEEDTETMYGQPCPENFELLPILLAGYLIIAKIMLCNLLIAILNNIYGDIQQNSTQVWKFNFFEVARWAEWKTVVPPPIGFLLLFFELCNSHIQEASLYKESHVEQLRIFEREMLISMTKTLSEAHRLTIDGQIKAVRESIGSIVDRVKGLHNLEIIAKRDKDKPSSMRAQSNWNALLKNVATNQPPDHSPNLRRIAGLNPTPPSVETGSKVGIETVTKMKSQINDLQQGFEQLEHSLLSALSEINKK